MPTTRAYDIHRWYEPQTGRYTKADPLGIRDDLHPYAYVASRPLRFIDPLGLSKITNNSCVPVYIKAEGSSSLVLLNPGGIGDGDGFYNSTPNTCSGFCDRSGPTPEVYKVNDWTDVSIGGGCNQGCLSLSTSGPVSWAANILDPRTGWQGGDFFDKHPDWPKPPLPPTPCCAAQNWE